MSLQDEHERRVALFPEDVREAHHHSSNHRVEIAASTTCGCFYCGSLFDPVRIEDWVDENKLGEGQTALCPVCGIDSVLGDKSGLSVTPEFLQKMKHYWFGE
jgi:hypothetical protein